MKHCPNCGIQYSETVWPRTCNGCHSQQWKRTDVVAVCLVPVHDRDKVSYFIGERGVGYALPGGFVEFDETVEQAAIREMEEETGLTILNPVAFASRNTQRGQLLVFTKCIPLDIRYVEENFTPTLECPSYRLVREPTELIFPLHQEILNSMFV